MSKRSKDAEPAPDGDEAIGQRQEDAEGQPYWLLNKAKRLNVQMYAGKPLISIREYYTDKASGDMKPGKKGIALTKEQWQVVKQLVAQVDEAIEAAESASGAATASAKEPAAKKAKKGAVTEVADDDE